MKSSKLIVLGLLFSTVFLINDTSVHAASMKSKSTVSFEEDTSSVDPLDPTNPDITNPITPTDPDDHEDGTAGPLSIDYVSNIRFGLNKASGKEEIYWATLDEIKDSQGADLQVPNFVQVTDKRGVWDGWHLTVTQEEQFYNASAKEYLESAELTIMNSVPNSADGGDEPTVSSSITLVPGTPSDVANATESKGSGTWSIRFGQDADAGKKSISLKVPAKTTKAQGEYSTTLTWQLSDSPI